MLSIFLSSGIGDYKTGSDYSTCRTHKQKMQSLHLDHQFRNKLKLYSQKNQTSNLSIMNLTIATE